MEFYKAFCRYKNVLHNYKIKPIFLAPRFRIRIPINNKTEIMQY